MRYLMDGKEVKREKIQEQLTAEMKAAENSPYFMGRIHYNLDHIEHVAKRFMRINGEKTFPFDNIVLIAE